MKYKTSELTGALLDVAVAKAEGLLHQAGEGQTPVIQADGNRFIGDPVASASIWSPSSVWDHGGPIIDRDHISTRHDEDGYSTPDEPWCAESGVFWAIGPTPLVAAMRAYVVSKFGDEVDL